MRKIILVLIFLMGIVSFVGKLYPQGDSYYFFRLAHVISILLAIIVAGYTIIMSILGRKEFIPLILGSVIVFIILISPQIPLSIKPNFPYSLKKSLAYTIYVLRQGNLAAYVAGIFLFLGTVYAIKDWAWKNGVKYNEKLVSISAAILWLLIIMHLILSATKIPRAHHPFIPF